MINASLNGGGQTSKSDLITHFTSRASSKLVAWGAGLGIRVIKLNIELLQLVLSLNVLKTVFKNTQKVVKMFIPCP